MPGRAPGAQANSRALSVARQTDSYMAAAARQTNSCIAATAAAAEPCLRPASIDGALHARKRPTATTTNACMPDTLLRTRSATTSACSAQPRYKLIAREGRNLALVTDTWENDIDVVLHRGEPGWDQLDGNHGSHDYSDNADNHFHLTHSAADAKLLLQPTTNPRQSPSLATATATPEPDESAAAALLATHSELLLFFSFLPAAAPTHMALTPQRGLLRYNLQHAGAKIEQDKGAEYHVSVAIAQFTTMTQARVRKRCVNCHISPQLTMAAYLSVLGQAQGHPDVLQPKFDRALLGSKGRV